MCVAEPTCQFKDLYHYKYDPVTGASQCVRNNDPTKTLQAFCYGIIAETDPNAHMYSVPEIKCKKEKDLDEFFKSS
jgi:hypothetical protein